MMVSTSSSSPFLRSSSPQLRISGRRPAPPPSSVRLRPRLVAAFHASAERAAAASTCPCPPKTLEYRASFYEVLGIPVGAIGPEIKAAYRQLARTRHPDVADVDRRESSADEFIKIHAAYSTLSDPDKRADYDRKLLPRHRPLRCYSPLSASAAAASRFSGHSPRRNWETDQCW